MTNLFDYLRSAHKIVQSIIVMFFVGAMLIVSMFFGTVFARPDTSSANPHDIADCRASRGVAVRSAIGDVVCVQRSAVIWEARNR